MIYRLVLSLFFLPFPLNGLLVGVGTASLTPPLETPSAGYADRIGCAMQGSDNTLLASAAYIDTGERQVVICSVDHLGFSHQMVRKIRNTLTTCPELAGCELYIASSHTHSGGGAYLDIPIVGHLLAGAYSEEIENWYCEQTVQAILHAYLNRRLAQIGIGYGKTEKLAIYRGKTPSDVEPLQELTVIKITTEIDEPLALLCHYPLHPTVLPSSNRIFSADFVGSLRRHITEKLNADIAVLYLNGAQAEILPRILEGEEREDACERIGVSLANSALDLWEKITQEPDCNIVTFSHPYTFKPLPNAMGFGLPLETYASELNGLLLNGQHALLMVPGELSTLYDRKLKEEGLLLGYKGITVWGLVNDAHGYMLLPESWNVSSTESRMSFGGEQYGNWIFKQLENWLIFHSEKALLIQ